MFDFKRFRSDKGLSQNDMANLLGMHQVSYGRIENGTIEPSAEKLKQYINTLKQSYPDLLEESYEYVRDTYPSIRQKTVVGSNYVGRLEKQSDDDRSALYQMIDTMKTEIEAKNRQILEKDYQIRSLLGIIEKFEKGLKPAVLGLR